MTKKLKRKITVKSKLHTMVPVRDTLVSTVILSVRSVIFPISFTETIFAISFLKNCHSGENSCVVCPTEFYDSYCTL